MRDILDGLEKLSAHTNVGPRALSADSLSVQRVLEALQSFSDIVRYLNTRRSRGAILMLENEAAVQDAIYLMLRPWVSDLVPEDPTGKIANGYSIKDFASNSARVVIEAKYVRDKVHGKSIVTEINHDIETYRYHAACDDLIFFIYDPDSNIPDSAAVERHLRTNRTYDTKVLRCHGVIKP